MVDLVDEHDAGGHLGRLLKEVPDAAGAHAHEHLHEVGAGDGEEGHLGLAGHGLGQQGLAGAGGAHQQRALGQLSADGGVFAGIVQEIDDLLQILLLLLKTCNILERYFLIIRGRHPGSAFSEIHHLRIASAASGHLPVHHHKEKEKDRAGKHYRKYCSDHGAVLGYIADRRIDIMFFKKRLRFLYIGYVDCLLTI